MSYFSAFHPLPHGWGLPGGRVKDFLDRVDTTVEVCQDLFAGGKLKIRLRKEFHIYEIRPISSVSNPLLQLADLFAGLAVFSWTHYNTFKQWQEKQKGQLILFSSDNDKKLVENKNISRSLQERCLVLSSFNGICKAKKLGVSLETRKGLWTPNPENPINFWLYEPQHPLDKAPTRR